MLRGVAQRDAADGSKARDVQRIGAHADRRGATVRAVVTDAQARALALALPGAFEQDHHGRASFRVSRKIFATLWEPTRLNVMLDREGILTAVQAHSSECSQFWWGQRLAALSVDLTAADIALVDELLHQAWELKAAKKASG